MELFCKILIDIHIYLFQTGESTVTQVIQQMVFGRTLHKLPLVRLGCSGCF